MQVIMLDNETQTIAEVKESNENNQQIPTFFVVEVFNHSLCNHLIG